MVSTGPAKVASELTALDGPALSKKRKVLKTYDTSPAQFLNSQGKSFIQSAKLDSVYALVSGGNDAAEYFSELCSDNQKRQQVHLSRQAVSLLTVLKELQQEHYKKVVDKSILNPAMKELQDLEPHLKILVSKEAVGDQDVEAKSTAGRLNYQAQLTVAGAPSSHSDEVVNRAGQALYEFSIKPKCALRNLIFALSGGGAFYVASVQDKVTRAWIYHSRSDKGTVPVEDVQAICRARLCSAAASVPDGEANPDIAF